MRLVSLAVSAVVLSGCATKAGNERVAQHGADQIRMVAVQREAQVQREKAQAAANEKLYEALARVAESDPANNGPAVAVALAVIGVSGGQSGGSDTDRVVTLQQQQNTALEWTKALAPTVGGLVTGLGVAAINADVAKTQSDNSRAVQESSNETSARIVESVASVGVANAGRLGIQVAGDYLSATDNAVIDQSVNTTETNSTVTTTTNTTESVNTSTLDTSTSYDATDDGFIVNGNYDYNYTTDSTVTYGGQETTLGGILQYLQGLGQPYSLTIDGEVVAQSAEGEGNAVTISCDGVMFSPLPPQCT
jgi:hypothetical protein